MTFVGLATVGLATKDDCRSLLLDALVKIQTNVFTSCTAVNACQWSVEMVREQTAFDVRPRLQRLELEVGLAVDWQ